MERRRDLENLRRRRALEERGIQRKEEDSNLGEELLEVAAIAVDWLLNLIGGIVVAVVVFAVVAKIFDIICAVC